MRLGPVAVTRSTPPNDAGWTASFAVQACPTVSAGRPPTRATRTASAVAAAAEVTATIAAATARRAFRFIAPNDELRPFSFAKRLGARPSALGWQRGELAAHGRRDLGAEQLDRAHDLRVRQRPDAELDEEAVVAEELVLEEDLLDDLLRAADEVRAAAAWPRRRSLARVCGGQPRSRPISSIIAATYGNDSSSACSAVSAM